ncbi:DUF4261 domain-containing protein [Streptococcus sp. SPS1]|uniref:DUF4261 domain-containing protein n=1 Tax=Streptococcus sp. SPS1 TaxID=3018247 RepID=UPI00263BEDCA|nr:DUF4261 domain-containing protein [Streptococcus sp. SPS1]MDN5027197.1 DUF4261 domain-containing protein [Streptococcus sp. SPS1]
MEDILDKFYVEVEVEVLNSDNIGEFCGSVLLSEDCWDKNKLIKDLRDEWSIEISNEDLTDEADDVIFTDINGYRVIISKFPDPVPNEEAEINASNNYMWREAVEVTKSHKAHIVVAVLGDGEDIKERGLIYTEVMAACSMQENAIGVFTSGVVFEPNSYIDCAQMIKEQELPIFNWIWFGLYQTDKGISAYTYGMDVFGKYELEIIDADENPGDLIKFISSIVSYILLEDVDLQDGETLGFSEKDKHKITLSKGVALPDQDTLKIAYEAETKKSWWRK